jgi:hypothetical protein
MQDSDSDIDDELEGWMDALGYDDETEYELLI